jgi:hypothetical protein
MQPSGVYAVARAFWTDADFPPEPYTQREAWLWLIGMAAWQPVRLRGNTGSPINLERAEFSFAVRFMAEKWRWHRNKVDRFISSLEKRDMIRDVSRDGSQVYSINSYNDFQVVGLPRRDNKRDAKRDSGGTDAGQQRDKLGALENWNIEVSKPAGAGGVGASKPSAGSYTDEFETFWRSFNVGKRCPNAKKPEAEKAWEQTASKRPPLDELLKLVAAYLSWLDDQSRKQKREYPCQHPSTWLRGEVWANYEVKQAGPVDVGALNAAWGGKAAALVAEIGAAPFKAWFGGSEFEQIAPRKCAITVGKSFQAKWVKDNYGTVLERLFGQCEVRAAA